MFAQLDNEKSQKHENWQDGLSEARVTFHTSSKAKLYLGCCTEA